MFQFFFWIIYIESIRAFLHRKLYTKTCYSSKSLWIFLELFLRWKCLNTPKPKNTPGEKCPDTPNLHTTGVFLSILQNFTFFTENPWGTASAYLIKFVSTKQNAIFLKRYHCTSFKHGFTFKASKELTRDTAQISICQTALVMYSLQIKSTRSI